MKYIIRFYEGSVLNTREVIDERVVESSNDLNSESVLPQDVWVNVNDIISRNAPGFKVYYHRLTGPFEDGHFSIDYGSYNNFVEVRKDECDD